MYRTGLLFWCLIAIGCSEEDGARNGDIANSDDTDNTGGGGDGAADEPCINGVQDEGEEGVDCGGGCPPCEVNYRREPPDPCYSQFWVAGCESGACEGRCQVANACSPPEDPGKADLPMTFACPSFMLFSPEMNRAARDDAAAREWGTADDPAFNYGVVGHDPDTGGIDGSDNSTCCHCYQLIFETPEPGSPQPPDLPIPKPLIVQSFNTAAGGPKNFDIFMGAGGYGAFNACYNDPEFGNTSTFGHFIYDAYPYQYPGQGGIKPFNMEECKENGTGTVASISSDACQDRITELCNQARADASPAVTNTTRASCIESNRLESFYHQNWNIRARRVTCPEALTRVTGCRLQTSGLPEPDPNARTAADADSSFVSGYTTTTMQDCCKPTCAWQDWVSGQGLTPDGEWNAFYSCDVTGAPITL